jgi:hypothetical protein
VSALVPKSEGRWTASAAAGGLGIAADSVDLKRIIGRARVAGRWLDQCLGARAGAWFARGLGLSFALMALFLARPLPEAANAILRLALVALSWCAGLAALSMAGAALERSLEAGRGVLESRGIALATVRKDRPLVLALWSLKKLGPPCALVLAACAAGTHDSWHAAQLLALAGGALVYITALGAGLGAVAHVCHALGGARAQSLLLIALLVPEFLSPAWPELPTVARAYAHLLDACLGLGVRS